MRQSEDKRDKERAGQGVAGELQQLGAFHLTEAGPPFVALKENGPQMEWGCMEVWPCWRKCVTEGVGLEIFSSFTRCDSPSPLPPLPLSYDVGV